MALYAIGDIHGSFEALKTIFKEHPFQKNDTVVFLGDYVDRGTNTKEVIDWLIENSKLFHFVFIRGNHEIMMLAARLSADKLMDWLEFGGIQTLSSYSTKNESNWATKIDAAHWAFLESTKAYHTVDDFIFVHAGLEPHIPLEKQTTHTLFWEKFKVPTAYTPNKLVICGHTARKNGEIADFGHTICIDTFAYGGMWLSCLNVETKEFIKANNKGQIVRGKL